MAPEEAVRAAMAKRADLLADRPDPIVLSDETLTRRMLEAAAPVLAEAWGLERLQAEHGGITTRDREPPDWPDRGAAENGP